MKRILYPIVLIAICSLCLMSCASTGKAYWPFCINEVFYGNGISSRKPGSVPGFIEFRNQQKRDLSLDGYYLSDEEDNLQKYLLDGYTIPGKGYLVIDVDASLLPADPLLYGVQLYLSDSSGNVLQYLAVPPLDKEKTYSLQPDGSWHISDPSPMADNLEGVLYEVQPPVFSQEAGFFERAFDLELGATPDCLIYYTTDGSLPDENSTLYTGPVQIEDATLHPNTLSMRTDITVEGVTPPDATLKKATVISAVAIDGVGNRSRVVTNSYFVGYDNYREYLYIPVISIVANPADLFDILDGIYVRGKTYQEWLENGGNKNSTASKNIPTNYRQTGPEWVIPVRVQEFDGESKLLFSQEAGLSIDSGNGRDGAQKPFDLHSADGDFVYAMVPETSSRERYTLMADVGKDSIVHGMLDGRGIPVAEARPCIVFLNGEFWGLYELREELDAEFISDNYDVDREDLIVVKDNNIEAGLSIVQKLGPEVQELGITGAMDLFFSELDTSTEEGYRAAESVIDVDNYLTYIVANVFFNNSELLNKYTMWRTVSTGNGKYGDGRLRWLLQDMESSFTSVKSRNALALLAENPVFTSLWNNESFRTRFYTLLMDYANVLYTTGAVGGSVTETLSYYDTYYRTTSERFMESDTSFNYAKTLRTTIMNFLKNRRTELISQCGATLTDVRYTSALNISGLMDEAKLLVNGNNACFADGIWEAVYFSGCEVIIEVKAIPGYKFLGWYDNGTLFSDKRVILVPTDTDHNLTPVFEAIPVIAVMDRINYARSNFKGAYELYTLNMKSGCRIVPDAVLKSSVDFKTISMSSESEWSRGTGFSARFSTQRLVACGMIFWLDVPEGCPERWNLYSVSEDGVKERIYCNNEMTDDGLKLSFDLPESCIGLPEVVLHIESTADCPGGTVKITKISLYGYGT